MALKLYEVETGATYWIAARNLRQATDTAWNCWEQEGALEDIEDSGFQIEPVAEERARKINVRDDGTGGERTLWDFMRDQEEKGDAAVIACSEW